MLHHYSAVTEELNHRSNAHVAAYELDPPQDLLDSIGTPPADPKLARCWIDTAATYTETRLREGPDVDPTDTACLASARWRDAVHAYHQQTLPAQDLSGPVLRRAL